MILQAMAIGIGLEDEDYFLRYHSGHENQLRLLHYPSVPAASLEEGSMTRMDAHSDWGSITMLFQDDCGGLQVLHPPPFTVGTKQLRPADRRPAQARPIHRCQTAARCHRVERRRSAAALEQR